MPDIPSTYTYDNASVEEQAARVTQALPTCTAATTKNEAAAQQVASSLGHIADQRKDTRIAAASAAVDLSLLFLFPQLKCNVARATADAEAHWVALAAYAAFESSEDSEAMRRKRDADAKREGGGGVDEPEGVDAVEADNAWMQHVVTALQVKGA